jgi:hypothetical protein
MEDCAGIGCTGSSSFGFFVIAVWLVVSFAVLFMETESVKVYIKEIPYRIIGFGIITAFFYGVLWLLGKLGL